MNSVKEFNSLVSFSSRSLTESVADVRTPMDVVVVLDVSGSMGGAKLSCLKHAGTCSTAYSIMLHTLPTNLLANLQPSPSFCVRNLYILILLLIAAHPIVLMLHIIIFVHIVRYIQDQLTDRDRFSIVTFNTRAKNVHGLLHFTEANKAVSSSLLAGIRSSGGTSILSGKYRYIGMCI